MLPVYVLAQTIVLIAYTAALEGFFMGGGLAHDGISLMLSSLGPSVSGALHRHRGRPRKFATRRAR